MSVLVMGSLRLYNRADLFAGVGAPSANHPARKALVLPQDEHDDFGCIFGAREEQ